MTEEHTPAHVEDAEMVPELESAPAPAATERPEYVGHGCPPKANQFKPG